MRVRDLEETAAVGYGAVNVERHAGMPDNLLCI